MAVALSTFAGDDQLDPGLGRVLVVDDDADTRANLCDILELDGHPVETAGTVAEVLARPSWDGIAAVLLDRKLPDGTAEDLLPRLRQRAPDVAVLIVTGLSDLQGAIAALRQGAADYILKPINPEALRASLLRIADRRRLALAKARTEAAFRTLVEVAPCLIVLLRPDHTILYFNRFAEEVTGYLATQVVGQNFLNSLLPTDFHVLMHDYIGQIQAGTSVRGVECPVLCREGSHRWVLWNCQTLADFEIPNSGTPITGPLILAIGQDITALKQSQERTLQAERLAAIGQMVTGLAHESGNALARSQACLEMLALEVQDRPEAMQLLGRIQNAQNHLQALYDEVRNYAAPLKLERESWPLDAVWRQAWANLEFRRQGRQASLIEHVAGVNLRCLIDPFRLEQVFRNILENALAACTDPVQIEITCSELIYEQMPALLISIRDNGPGLSAEARQRIFEPFFTTKTKGTGLGMAIAQRIVEAHGGVIRVGDSAVCSEKDLRTLRSGGAEIQLILPRDPA
jgi:two-component system sensor kinase FixL